MNDTKRILIIISCALVISGCSTVRTGPLTGKKYKSNFFDVDQNGLQGYYREARLDDYLKQYPDTSDEIKKDIMAGVVSMGMTQNQAFAAWGRPNDTNKFTSANGTSEQWIYNRCSWLSDYCTSHQYLHFTNGILTSTSDI